MFRKLKICRITSAFPPPWAGLGPGPYELSAAQAELGHEVTVITKYAEGCKALDREAPFQVRRLRAGRNLSFGFMAALEFRKLHRREKFDLIHSHGDSAVPLLLFRKLFPRVPVVSSVHILRKAQFKALDRAEIYQTFRERRGPGMNGMLPGKAARAVDLWKERLYVKNSDFLAAVSEGIKDDITSEYGMAHKVSVVLNGVNTHYFDSARRDGKNGWLKKSGSNGMLLFVGVLNGRKGEFDLIKAMKRVTVEHPDSKLVVIGDGPTRKFAIEMAGESGLAKKIVFIPNVPRSRMSSFYAASELFVLPSYSEGLPKALIEAMACGTAAVVSDIPAHKGVIRNRETGYLFRAGDTENLAAILLEALQGREERERIAQAARAFVKEHCTWQNVARRIDRIYDDCKRQRPGTGDVRNL